MIPKSTAPTDNKLASSSHQHQDDDAEEQRERNVDADDDGAAEIAQKDPLDEEHQSAAEYEIVQYGMRGNVDQRRAIVERHDLHARRQ